MTFSILGRDPATNQFGIAVTTSSIAVGARCPFVRAGVGAASTQNITDPRLGPAMLDLMADGASAAQAVAETVASARHIAYRQLVAIDADGGTAVFSGDGALAIHAAAEGRDCVAAGNLLANDGVPAAMTASFEASEAAVPLAARLVAARRAGLDAGGEGGEVMSATLLIADPRAEWPVVDLRVDWQPEPIAVLAGLWRAYQPQVEAYLTRALDPDAAPGYGVPGDP